MLQRIFFYTFYQQGGIIMNKKVVVSILAISSVSCIIYALLKKSCIQKGNKIIPASSVYSAILNTQKSYKDFHKESVESL